MQGEINEVAEILNLLKESFQDNFE